MLGPVVCDIASTELTPQEARRIAHRHVGMVILFTRNYENPQQLARLCAQIHSVKPGVLIAVDHEGGRVQRFREGFTEIPSMHAYGEMYKNDPEAAARALTAAGFVLASELRSCGVDFSFAPVLDLDWGRSAIIGERSFGLDPRVVVRLARALSQGMLMAGFANCGKHFPGHGWAQADSHVALPVDERPAERIELADTKPYSWMGIGLACAEAFAKAGAVTVMADIRKPEGRTEGKEADSLHELGILMGIIKTVENYAVENQVGKIEKLVLQIGEISSVIPEYMRKVYPAAVEDTLLAEAELEIEILPANAECRDCGNIFHATVTGGICPDCGSRNMHLISGRDFLLWQLKKSVKVKENASKLLDFCPGKAKTSQKLLISLHFSVLSGQNRLI